MASPVMTPGQVKALLPYVFQSRRAAFLAGPPGIGKSQVVAQVCASLNRPLIDVRLATKDPVDLEGVLVANNGSSHYSLPDWLPRDPNAVDVLFLDELSQAPPLVQSAALGLVLDRRIGSYVLPEGVSILAAGNRQSDRAGAHKLGTALANRFVQHIEMGLSHDDWQAWALETGIEPSIRSFIRAHSKSLHCWTPDCPDYAQATPRSWHALSDLLKTGLPEELVPVAAANAVGSGKASEYCAFRNVYGRLPDPDMILSNPIGVAVPQEADVTYALIGSLVERLKDDPSKATAFGDYVTRMSAMFATVAVMDAIKVTGPRFIQIPSVNTWRMANPKALGSESL